MLLYFKLLFVCYGVARSEVLKLDHRYFLGQIIQKYGHNGTISYEGFERLYNNLGLGNVSDASNSTSRVNSTDKLSRTGRNADNSSQCESEKELTKLVNQHDEVPRASVSLALPLQRCLSPRELLSIYELPGSSTNLTPVGFLHLCPAIIYELDHRTCAWHEELHHHQHAVGGESSHTSWFFAIATVVVISISGLLSVALVPLLQKTIMNQLTSFLVALAVGTLLGDAFLHLIPHALVSHSLGSKHSHTDSLMKTGLMFLTVLFFFIIEAVLNINRNRKEKNKSSHNVTYVSVNINQNEKEMMEISEEQHHNHSHTPYSNTALIVIMGDGLHNLTDGLAIGAAFSGGLAAGFATAFAVFTHELPHELGDFAVLLQSGVTVRKALQYNLLSSFLSILGTVLGLVVGHFGDATRWIYPVTAGSFIYIALTNLVPEINKEEANWKALFIRLFGILCGGAVMGAIALYEDDLQHLFL